MNWTEATPKGIDPSSVEILTRMESEQVSQEASKGRPRPHDIGYGAIGIRTLRILIVATGAGANDDHVQAGIDPVIADFRFGKLYF